MLCLRLYSPTASTRLARAPCDQSSRMRPSRSSMLRRNSSSSGAGFTRRDRNIRPRRESQRTTVLQPETTWTFSTLPELSVSQAAPLGIECCFRPRPIASRRVASKGTVWPSKYTLTKPTSFGLGGERQIAADGYLRADGLQRVGQLVRVRNGVVRRCSARAVLPAIARRPSNAPYCSLPGMPTTYVSMPACS